MPQRRTTALAAPQRRTTALAAPQRRVTALAAPQRRVTALAALCAALLVAAAWGFHVGNTPTPAVPVAHRVATTTRAQATTKQPTTRIKAVPPTTTPTEPERRRDTCARRAACPAWVDQSLRHSLRPSLRRRKA